MGQGGLATLSLGLAHLKPSTQKILDFPVGTIFQGPRILFVTLMNPLLQQIFVGVVFILRASGDKLPMQKLIGIKPEMA